jgi:carbon-monoxide dehydrogenase medium subunit
MKPSQFTYQAPATIDEALAALAAVAGDDGRVIAGGQSLVPAMALRLAQPPHLIDINGVSGLDRLAVEGAELSIGACVRHVTFEKPVEPGPLGRLLASVVRHIAHKPIRTRGTFCGSVANADPASEWCLVAAVLGATMVAKSVRGERRIAAAEFFEGIMSTALAPDELLAEVRLPLLGADTKGGFNEFNRRAGDFAIAMSLATYRVAGGVIADARVGVGGVEGHPRRIVQAEALLNGKAPSAFLFAAAADVAATVVEPLEEKADLAEYKRDVTRAVVKRALEAAEKS